MNKFCCWRRRRRYQKKEEGYGSSCSCFRDLRAFSLDVIICWIAMVCINDVANHYCPISYDIQAVWRNVVWHKLGVTSYDNSHEMCGTMQYTQITDKDMKMENYKDQTENFWHVKLTHWKECLTMSRVCE